MRTLLWGMFLIPRPTSSYLDSKGASTTVRISSKIASIKFLLCLQVAAMRDAEDVVPYKYCFYLLFGIQFIKMPPHGIVKNIIGVFLVILLIANDVVVERFLPNCFFNLFNSISF